MSSDLSTFNELKRKVYLYVIPIILFTLFMSLFSWNSFNFFEKLAAVTYLLLFSCSFLFIYKNLYFRFIELTIFCLVSFFHLFLTYWTINIDIIQNHQDSISDSAIWTPLLFIYIFITFVGNLGMILAFILWTITTGILLIYSAEIPSLMVGSFINYQLAMFVYIIFLFFGRNLLEASARTGMLEKMAYKDMLTGIDNRRAVHHMFEKLDEEGKAYSILFFDIDHFKKVNDQYGHSVGDSVLIEITKVINSGLNKNEFFARWGGEEFIVITKNETIEKTLNLAKKLKLLVNQHQFKVVGKLTASFGIAESQPGQTAELVLEQADQALYSAKANGRNHIMVFGDQN
ncbi:GGDEF domain-containing protein [Metabacillus sp. B2-18]|uniref:GGDEF domain-containing protein n=1 Tax=Metabacillus sp. B2-18 TaxID=2897333 RepID=UPI001E30ED31|nr:GGDEF domain-containing protein [Metabacillus sp. B2-18]UGB30238.1 GGDEF domain-containing protein [Metabacillus sp. B2-18]